MKGPARRLFPAFVVAFVAAVVIYNNARETPRHFLRRRALLHPKFSPWRRLLNFGDEGSFLEMTGFNLEGFRELVRSVATEAELNPGPRGPGRPKLLNIEDEVGLYLYYVNSTMKSKHLSQLFGVLPGSVSTTIRQMMTRVINALKNHDDAKIRFPATRKHDIKLFILFYYCTILELRKWV